MDLIERGAAIDALNDYLIGKRCFDNGTMMAQFIERNVLRKLPPAQPEELDTLIKALEAEHKKLREMKTAQSEIIRCKDCENWDTTWKNDWAKNYHYCPLIDGTRRGDWYCADAERRTDERSD